MPGTTITFSSRQAWKKLRPSEIGAGEAFEVNPHIEGSVRNPLDDEAHVAQALDNIITLVAEVPLQRHHLLAH